MTQTLKLELPWPPSVNRYYRTVLGRMLISKEGREYRKAIAELVDVPEFFIGRVAVTVECHAPDKRRRDLDNLCKCLFDSLTGVVWDDDSQIDDMRVVRAGVMPRGMVRVEIRGIA